MLRVGPAIGLAVGLVVALGACSSEPSSQAPSPSPSATERSSQSAHPSQSAQSPSPRPSTSTRPAPGTVPPAWLGDRPLPRTPAGYGEIRPTPPQLRTRRFTLPDTVDPLPGKGFASKVVSPAPDAVIARSTWAPGCPVGRDQLAWVRLAFWGFDDRRHTGELLVNARVADDLVKVFRQLYAARFPLEEMRITRADELDAPPTGDGDNTGAFNCRPSTGDHTTYSQHAYGLAIDVNPFQNPYVKGDGPDRLVLPELASAYADRSRLAPGIIHPDGPVVRAFASIGWTWGGSWHSAKDYEHFSENGY